MQSVASCLPSRPACYNTGIEKIDRTEKIPAIYVAYSKYNFFAKQLISAFVLEQGVTSLNPFMNWDYFLNDLVPLNFASLEFEQELLDAYSREEVVAQMKVQNDE